MTYYNFHCHSVYSAKDALPEPEEIALKNKELGNDAFCITDHGTMMSFIKAFQTADKLDMQFIPGCEFYIVPKDKYWKYNEKNNKDIEVEDFAVKYHHLIAIAKNQKGISSLFSLYNSGEEHYKKVCITEENLFKYSEGLIVTNACASGELIYYLRYGLIDEAEDFIKRYQEHFKEDFYLELQFHHLTFIDEAKIYNQIVEFAKKYNIKMIVTTDSHFINKEDKQAHDIYKNIFFKDKKYNFEKGCFDSAFDGEGYYIKNEAEIRNDLKNITALTQKDIDEIINNTVELRNKCEKTEFPKGKDLTNKSKELRELVEKGFQEKRVGTDLERASRERLEEELSVIEKMGFTEYFINVYNIINRAKELGILAGAARGCFLPGNKVSTLNLYGNKGINEDPMQVIEKIKIGQKVLTHDGKFHKVLNVLIYEVQDEDCIEIQLSNGHTIKCTADHRIFKKDVGFVEAKNLKKNDILNGAYRQKDIMDIQCDKCGKPLKRHFKKYRRSVLHNDIEITDIKHFKYTGKVYDLTVENTHNYTVGRVSVHNSAAGSEVCYLTDIVKIDPIKNHLMFERFLNPSRFNYPDIDMDLAVTPYPAILEQMSQKEGN